VGAVVKEETSSPRRQRRSKIPRRKDSYETKPNSAPEVSSAPAIINAKTNSSSSSSLSFSYNQINERRSRSLTNQHRSEKEALKKRKKRTPTVAMTTEQYKAKRGILNSTPKKTDDIFADGEKSNGRKRSNKVSILVEDFDIEKHLERNRRITSNKAKTIQ